ncbi:MAG TPA: MerR family transcriptional regulator [Nitrospiria bacterium]|nr:MerR family transcriptional regulator [Nitrospiria bacterium]
MAYNTSMVIKLTGLSERQVDYWDRTHFIKPSIKEASGYGTTRLYSFSDLVQLKVAKTLRETGISLQKIRKTITYLKKNFPDLEQPLAELRFLTEGETIFVLTKDKNVMLDTLSEGQMVFAIAIGKIIEGLNGQVAAISQDRRYKVSVKGKSYGVILHPDLEGGGFWVECPSLPGCTSQGNTVEEALQMISDAIIGHLEKEGSGSKEKEGYCLMPGLHNLKTVLKILGGKTQSNNQLEK